MQQKYPSDIEEILNDWSDKVSKLANIGKISPSLAENIKNLINNGEIENTTKIRFAIESGVKNNETD